jgi:uncharacterized membrane protein
MCYTHSTVVVVVVVVVVIVVFFFFYDVAGAGRERESHVIGGDSQSRIERRRPVGIKMGGTVGWYTASVKSFERCGYLIFFFYGGPKEKTDSIRK